MIHVSIMYHMVFCLCSSLICSHCCMYWSICCSSCCVVPYSSGCVGSLTAWFISRSSIIGLYVVVGVSRCVCFVVMFFSVLYRM